MRAALAGLAALTVLATGCGRAEGVRDTRRALERAGYTQVDVTVRSGGGIDVVSVDAVGPDAERATQIVWTTVPVRFDQLVVSVGTFVSADSYEALVERFGPRNPDLDRRQISDQVVRDGLDLMLLLTLGAVLSVAGVVTLGLLVVRTARGRGTVAGGEDDQAVGPISGLGDADDSPTAGASPAAAEAEGPEAIPS